MRTFTFRVPSGDAGTRAIVGHMKRLVREGKVSPLVRDLALSITSGVPGRKGVAQAVAIRNWLAINVDFTRDPDRAELLYTPQRLSKILTERGPPLRMDCDDVAVLAAALGASIGLKSRFQLVGFLSPKAPFRHVWTELASPSGDRRWVQMDVTRASQPLPMDRAVKRRWTVKL
jgi:transglutaminase-like putative cysteine protease